MFVFSSVVCSSIPSMPSCYPSQTVLPPEPDDSNCPVCHVKDDDLRAKLVPPPCNCEACPFSFEELKAQIASIHSNLPQHGPADEQGRKKALEFLPHMMRLHKKNPGTELEAGLYSDIQRIVLGKHTAECDAAMEVRELSLALMNAESHKEMMQIDGKCV